MNTPLILFVDDDKSLLKILAEGLRDHNMDVIATDSPADALEKLKSVTPDVIIADLKMDPMNGFEFFQQIKKIPRLSTCKFFFLTGVEDPLAKKYGASLGAVDYFCKPVDLPHLVASINQSLQQ